MKLCPQCDFIYEDDQTVCDMDGKELVFDSATAVTDQSFASPVSETSEFASDLPPSQLGANRWRAVAVATVIGFALAALVIAVYLAGTRQIRSRRAPEVSEPAIDRSPNKIPAQSSSENPSGQPPSDLASTQTPVPVAQDSKAQSIDSSSAPTDPTALSPSANAKESLAHTRLTPGSVSAGATSVNNRGPVIVRLTNGSAIRADEAWEKREGIWYRQGSVVTFLKRSQVRTIERLPPPTQPARSATINNAGQKSKQPETKADAKNESKVTSFFKKTGQILKKPFKF